MKYLWLIALTFLPFNLLANTDGFYMTNVEGRKHVSLDGTWKTIVDPLETGYYDYRKQPSAEGFFNDLKQNNPDLIEYNFDTSDELIVPCDWNTQKRELYYYEGCMWYRKSFDAEPKAGKRYFIHFGAVNYESIVWLNGKKLGSHVGGYTPFCFEVSGLLKPGKNSLVLKVNNNRRKDGVPTDNFDWWNYGGITRSVTLIETPEVFIRDYMLQLSKSEKNTLEGWIQLDGVTTEQNVTLSIPELKKSIVVKVDGNKRTPFKLSARPELWDPENPKMYSIELTTAFDTLSDEVGFRTIACDGNKILLNGKPLFLRGVSIHEEAPFRGNGRANSREDARTLLKWAKEMNCNFARLAHYPHNEHMIREAEKMGVLLWAEVPVYWTIDWDNPSVLENAKNQMSEVVQRDRNRCSIIIWSVANETPHGDARLRFLKNLVEHTRSLDSSRLVGAAMEKIEKEPGVMTVEDDLGQYLDVMSFNQYIGWYDGLPEKCDRVRWDLPTNKPIIITEFGGGALYGLHGDKSQRWTEEFQEDMYDKNINMISKITGLAGTTPWILMDFRSPKRPLKGIQDDYNRKGLVSNNGQKKLAFYRMKEWYQQIKDSEKK